MENFATLLSGGDLRSIGKSNEIVLLIDSQYKFDELFKQLFCSNRLVVMRAADVIEKITVKKTGYLDFHKQEILKLCENVKNKELKWHLALIVSRLKLTKQELAKVWQCLESWVTDKNESRIVRVNGIQALFNLLPSDRNLFKDFALLLSKIEKENIPSLNARITKLKNTQNYKNLR